MATHSILPYGQRVAWLRRQKGLRQVDLAVMAGVSAKTVWNVEHSRPVWPTYLVAIAHVLDVEIIDIVAPGEDAGWVEEGTQPVTGRFQTTRPYLWYVPQGCTPYFTGRANLLQALHHAFTSNQNTVRPQALIGLGGVGKTQLALRYAHLYADQYDAVLWIQAGDATMMATDYARLANRLHLLGPGGNEQMAVTAIMRWLEQHSNWLLVLDNADDPTVVRLYLPSAANGHVLITSRNVDWGDIAHPVSVPVFERHDSITFLCGRTQQDDETHAMALAEAVGDLPLALSQAAAYMAVTRTPLAAYLALFRSRRRELWAEERPPLDYPDTVQTTWTLAIDQLQQGPPGATEFLYLCAYLAPEDLPLTLLTEGAEMLPSPLNTVVADPIALNRVVAALRRYSLIERHHDAITIHRLVQAVTRDQLTDEAHHFWIDKAVQLMLRVFSNAQEAGHAWPVYARWLPHALAVITHAPELPATPTRTQQELSLLLTLGPKLMATRGYGAFEVQRIYTRARELAQQEHLTLQLFQALFGLWTFHHLQAQHLIADELGQQLLSLAKQANASDLRMEAHLLRGCTLWSLGKFRCALNHLNDSNDSAAYDDPEHHQTHTQLYGQDPIVMGHCYAAHALWMLGYPDQALQRSAEARKWAQQSEHPYNQAFAQFFTAVLYYFLREAVEVQKYAEATLALATRHGFPQWEVNALILRGWGLTAQGEAEGIEQIRQGVAAWQEMGSKLSLPILLAQWAEGAAFVERVDEGLRRLTEAQKVVEETGEHWWKAELHRLKGELLLQQAIPDEYQAETCFHQASTIARRQQANSLELRAVVSLSRLWQQQGKRAAARALLAPVYGWFTEGFDTADLQEAKALLEELA